MVVWEGNGMMRGLEAHTTGGCGERGFLTRINPRNEVGVGLGLMRGLEAHTTGEGLPQIKHRHT